VTLARSLVHNNERFVVHVSSTKYFLLSCSKASRIEEKVFIYALRHIFIRISSRIGA